MNIGVVGGGFCGILVSYHLLAHGKGAVRVTLFDQAPEECGAAYSTSHSAHLLNVRAKNMGAFPGTPGDFVRWLEKGGRFIGGDEFLPRGLYRQYLTAIRDELPVRFPGCFTLNTGRVDSLTPEGTLRTANETHSFDALVLALGEGAPRSLSVEGTEERVLQNPWAAGALERIPDGSRVLLIGSGLTAVDIFLALRERISSCTMLSRHALLPRAHERIIQYRGESLPWEAPNRKEMFRRVHMHIRQSPSWQSVFEWMRPHYQQMWRALNEKEQARLLRHFLPYWNVLRHRMAPSASARLEDAQERGLLSLQRGAIRRITGSASSVEASTNRGETFTADYLINCTGPAGEGATLVRTLLDQGIAARGTHGLGLASLPTGQLIAANEEIQRRIFLVGGLRKGLLWETTAVPDLRSEALKTALNVLAAVR